MADKEIKEGDQVSWNWSGANPGGKATEVKEGDINMETKSGNTVTKHGEEGNPAVYIERSGHDVVKKASELNVDKPGDKHTEDKGEEKEVSKDDKKGDEKKENGNAETGDKRKADDDAEDKKDEDAKKQKKDEPRENGDAPKKKGRPAKKDANGSAAPKKETKKKGPKKAATESGEPRRSGRNKS